MSVIACYARLNSESLDACRAAPDWVETLYAKTFPSAEVIDIDEACDGIVWLLTRVPAPANANVESTGFVVRRSLAPLLRGQSGLREGQLDAGHGPASTLSNQQVAELSAWLQSIDPFRCVPDTIRTRWTTMGSIRKSGLRRVWRPSTIICCRISVDCRHSFCVPPRPNSRSWSSSRDLTSRIEFQALVADVILK